jgi:DNA-binding beta-propeller fold protein YncE
LARSILLAAASLMWPAAAVAQPAAGPPLVLETKIPLGQVSGRIDHLGIDVKRQRLFVAELGNNSLGVVDLAAGKVLSRIAGFREPQGVVYVPFADSVYVANAGDGSVHVLRGDDLAPIGRIELGEDADNVRVDTRRNRVLVGYGNGALAVIDPATRTKAADIRLKGHPESFQIDETGTKVFVNVPDAHDVEVADLASEANRSLPMHGAGSNFPMAIDGEAHRVLVVFRNPPTLMALSSQDGRIVAKIETCGDADDVFVDPKRRRVYVSCGEGVVDVLEQVEAGYRRLARVPTVSGARTSLFVPELDRLFVAVRARSREPAAIWVFRPAP